MKKLLISGAFVALFGLALAGSAKADTISAGGVTYTFTDGEVDGGGVSDVILVIDTTGATASGSLSSFSVQFTGASNVTLETSPAGWSVLGQGPNNPSGCNINGSANLWCSEGPAIAVNAGGSGDGTFTFVFDVTDSPLPTDTHIQAFQGQGALAISNDVGIGSASVPEPASLTLLGLGLLGVPFLRRRT
jgi:hypothetical protein